MCHSRDLPCQLGLIEVEPLDQPHLLHQVEGHTGERLSGTDGIEVEGVVLPAVDVGEGLGQLRARGANSSKDEGFRLGSRASVGRRGDHSPMIRQGAMNLALVKSSFRRLHHHTFQQLHHHTFLLTDKHESAP